MSWTNSNGEEIEGPTEDDDFFQGTGAPETEDGLGGNDALRGAGGNDSLAGGAGDDYLQGDAGDDTLVGGAGEDGLLGGSGHDSIVDEGGGATYVDGGTGNDTIVVAVEGPITSYVTDLRGGDGDDSIVASGPGLDDGSYLYAPRLIGDGGNDTIIGTDVDEIWGGDEISGGTGDDSILAGAGNDLISLGTGNDTVDAGSGDDAIDANGIASVVGGTGDDTLSIRQTDATTALGFTVDGAGVMTGSNGSRAVDVEHFDIRTGSGDDTVIAGDGNDWLVGAGGSDSLVGGAGDDYLQGDAGNDTLIGGAGFDQLGGGIGDDSITDSGGGDVYVDGGAGHDTIVVTVAGAEWGFGAELRGGDGNDSIVASGPGLEVPGGRIGALLYGGAGDDTILGTDADDPGYGGDNISGDDGNDSIIGNKGEDYINAGAGDDTIVWRIGDGNDVIDAGSGTDQLNLEGWTGDDTDDWTVATEGGQTLYTHGSGAVLTTTGIESVVCFATGTRILTPRGEVPVETLRTGDLVIVPFAAQRVQPLRWVGHRHIDVAATRDRAAVAPVLIRAGALGEGMPCRDMRVSPEHAFLIDGHLVPARLLIDGVEIAQEHWCSSVTYWHLELETHDLLVADGALAKSYFDDGNRQFFDNPGLVALHPSFDRGTAGRYATEACAPVILDPADPMLARIRPARRRIA